MPRFLLALALSFALSAALTPLVSCLAKKLKLRQTILSYVDNHSAKAGTPTMGGVAFTLACIITTLIFLRGASSLAKLLVLLTLGFMIVGFLDDFIKVFFARNEGLKPLQKIVFQLIIALSVSIFAVRNPVIGDKLYLPFTFREVRLGVLAVPFYTVIFIAFTNAVNLTDGLDGLAGKTGVVYATAFTTLVAYAVYSFGSTAAVRAENSNMIIFSLALIGALMGFLLFNSYPASIFMGDTGSLALGGALAGLAIFSKASLIAPIIGIMYVVSCLSDIIQVAHYKRTKKRVFLMAPFHHHLERKGMHENKIVTLYSGVTFVAGIITVTLTILLS